MATKNTPAKGPVITAAPVPDSAEKLFNEIKKALHGGGDSKQWLLPPQGNKIECIVPIIVE